MSKFSYGATPQAHLLTLNERLSEGEWATVAELPQLDLDSPMIATHKTLILAGVKMLASAISGEDEGAQPADNQWDRAQTRYDLRLQLELQSDDPSRRQAAERLRRDTLSGQGRAQTQLTFRDEVAFGRKQLAILAQEPHKSHIATLGLDPEVAAIQQTTDALDQLVNANPADATPRHRRVDLALAELRQRLQAAHRDLDALSRHASSKADRDRADSLLKPLADLQR